MYISHQGQQAIYQDIVNEGLRRSERRRMLKERDNVTDTQAREWNLGTTLTALVRSMLNVSARPQL